MSTKFHFVNWSFPEIVILNPFCNANSDGLKHLLDGTYKSSSEARACLKMIIFLIPIQNVEPKSIPSSFTSDLSLFFQKSITEEFRHRAVSLEVKALIPCLTFWQTVCKALTVILQ